MNAQFNVGLYFSRLFQSFIDKFKIVTKSKLLKMHGRWRYCSRNQMSFNRWKTKATNEKNRKLQIIINAKQSNSSGCTYQFINKSVMKQKIEAIYYYYYYYD